MILSLREILSPSDASIKDEIDKETLFSSDDKDDRGGESEEDVDRNGDVEDGRDSAAADKLTLP